MPVFKIHHITKYQYNQQVKESINEVRISPYQCPEQEVLQHQLIITRHPNVYLYQDYWGNTAGTFNLEEAHQELIIESKLVVRTTLSSELEMASKATLTNLKNTKLNLRLLELSRTDFIEKQRVINDIIAELATDQKPVADIVKESCEYIFQNFQYIKGITSTETTVDEILQHKSGVCQDFAHVLLQILRTIGIPSRYVSGYICPNKNGMRGEGATHAWVEAWIPEQGWKGIDPTNNVWVTNKHIKLAVGRNFNDCSPTKGTFKGLAEQKLSVYVSVGYEDGVTFEELNDVRMHITKEKKQALMEMQAQQ